MAQELHPKRSEARERLALDLNIYRGLRAVGEMGGLDRITEDLLRSPVVLKRAEPDLYQSIQNFSEANEARGIT